MAAAHKSRISLAQRLLRKQRGVAVTYHRRGGNSIPIALAILTKPVSKTETSQGSARREQAQDWLIAAADLDDGGTLFPPAKDDTITYDDGTTVETYSIQPFNGRGDSEHEDSDAAGSQFRIHTKLIKSEPSA